jgi:hypothetical protein
MKNAEKVKPKARAKLALVALLLVSISVFSYINARPVPLRMEVKFIGFTNTGTTYTTKNGTHPVILALLCISNAGSAKGLEWGICSHEVKDSPPESGARWAAPDLLSELKPGESKTVSVMPPWDNTQPWRVNLYFSKIDWRYSLMRTPPWMFEIIKSVASEKWLMNYHEGVFHSEWLPSPELMTPGATNAPLQQPPN